MYVEDVEDRKRTYTHIYAHNFLNIQPIFNPQKSFGKLRLRAILCIFKHVEDVEDRSNAPKGCNAIYVKEHTHTFMLITFLIHRCLMSFGKPQGFPTIPFNIVYI